MSTLKTHLNLKNPFDWILFLLMLLMAYLLVSCSASWHIRQAERKDPGLFDTIQHVTIDTIIKEIPKRDTAVVLVHDTLIRWKTRDNAVLSYIVRRDTITKRDTLEITVDCPDCEEITKTVTESITITKNPRWLKVLTGFAIAAVIFLLALSFLRIKK